MNHRYYVLAYYYRGVSIGGYAKGFYVSSGPIHFARDFAPGLKEYKDVGIIENVVNGSFIEFVDEWGKGYVIQLGLEKEDNWVANKSLYAITSHIILGVEQRNCAVLVYANSSKDAVKRYIGSPENKSIRVIQTPKRTGNGCYIEVRKVFDFGSHSSTKSQLEARLRENDKVLFGLE